MSPLAVRRMCPWGNNFLDSSPSVSLHELETEWYRAPLNQITRGGQWFSRGMPASIKLLHLNPLTPTQVHDCPQTFAVCNKFHIVNAIIDVTAHFLLCPTSCPLIYKLFIPINMGGLYCTVHTSTFASVTVPLHSPEAKSVTIRRMQSNLEEWDRKLQDICDKKAKNGEFVLH